MNCRRLAKIMPELAAGELDDIIRTQSLEHIESCPACRAEYDSYKRAMEALSCPRLMAEISEDITVPQVNQLQPSLRRKYAYALAAAVPVLAVTVYVLLPHVDDNSAQREKTIAVAPVDNPKDNAKAVDTDKAGLKENTTSPVGTVDGSSDGVRIRTSSKKLASYHHKPRPGRRHVVQPQQKIARQDVKEKKETDAIRNNDLKKPEDTAVMVSNQDQTGDYIPAVIGPKKPAYRVHTTYDLNGRLLISLEPDYTDAPRETALDPTEQDANPRL